MSQRNKFAAIALSTALAIPTGAAFVGTAAAAAPTSQVQTARLLTAADKTMYVKSDNTNVRTGPGTNNDWSDIVGKGTKVTVTKTQNGWSKVSYTYYFTEGATKKESVQGWIRSDLLTSTKPAFIPMHGTSGLITANLVLRKEPSKTAAKILTIPEKGEPWYCSPAGENLTWQIVEVGEKKGNWIQARYNNKTGWINLDYVELGSVWCD